MLEAAKAAAKGEAFSRDARAGGPAAQPERRLSLIRGGRFVLRAAGVAACSVDGAIILPRAPENLVKDRLAVAERCVVRDAYRYGAPDARARFEKRGEILV